LVFAAPGAVAETLHVGVRDIRIEVPGGWSFAQHANIHKIYSIASDEQASLDAEGLEEIVQISVHTYRAPDHAAALMRLREIASEGQVAPTFLEIGGWPALQRRRLVPRPQPGADPPDGDVMVWMATTAVAVEEVVVRLEAWVPPDSDALLATVDAIGASLTTSAIGDPAAIQREIQELQAEPLEGLPLRPVSEASSQLEVAAASGAPQMRAAAAGAPAPDSTIRVTNAGGFPDSELEIAVSDDGMDIVIGANSSFFFSSDAGQNWGTSVGVGASDPSVAWGQSGGARGTFYAANISGTTTGFWTSTTGGATFTGPVAAYTCGQAGDPACGAAFPDQEHIAADRFNVTAGGDQVYSAWRHLDGNWGIVCSTDGGTTWSTNGFFAPGDLPKINVGQDGFVYVVYHPDSDDNIRLSKFNSCESNQNPMVRVFDVLVVSNPTAVACPTPGLDRCNFRNSLASPTVAVDDTDPDHVYVAYASNTNPGGGGWWPTCNNQNLCNEDIVVQDSIDGGSTWLPGDADRTVVISSGITARRFMPWVCTAGGAAYVSWYDRRAAFPGGTTVSNNSLTDFYRGSASLNPVGNLVRGTEMQINEIGSTDAQCEAGAATGTVASWWSPVDAQGDSESCSVQPQLGGYCCVPAEIDGSGRCLAPSGASSQAACDFSPDTCPAGEQCAARRGAPKYGDYNGSACAAGRFYMTWASATSPPTLFPASTDIDAFFTSDLVCCEPEIQVPNPVDFGTVCADASDTLEVCNTGVEDLVVGSITSSDAEFAVTDPVGGYPVTISADFCFPFQVTFDTSNGSQVGTLTVNSNDPVTPAFAVPVSGAVGAPDLNLAIANSGDFGGVCLGEHSDLDLTLFNQGDCNLTIASITSSDAQFVLPGATGFPLVLSPDAQFTLPVRFEPTSLGAQNATITITSDDPDTPVEIVAVSGDVSPGDIRVTGNTDFGDVCAEDPAEKTVSVCNVGPCNLQVTSASVDCPDFTLINNPFPAAVSPDFCIDLVVAFTPTSAGPKSCTLTINSDDPDTPVTTLDLTANTPFGSIDVPPDQAFRPTVVQSVDVCESAQPFPVSNTGRCDLDITDLSITANAAEYSLSGLPSFPIILEPGHVAGSGDLNTVFAPDIIDRDREGTVSVTYVHDPITGATATEDRALCGEGVYTGARVLVTHNGIPLPEVKSIRLHRINANRNKNRLDTVDNARQVPLQTVTPNAPCAPFVYHREYGTVSNPVQLLPGSYEVTVQTRINGRMTKRTVGFDVNSCGFNPTIVVNF
jgi:hypothetical protein